MNVHCESQHLHGSVSASAEWGQTYELVRNLLIDHLGVTASEIALAARLDEDLAMDSLELLDFGLILNETQHIELAVDVLGLADTVEDMVNLVHAALLERRGGNP